MPDRIIRERARRSPTLHRLSDSAERAWWRLTVSADDYGRIEADPELLLAALFPRRPPGWTRARIAACVQEWAQAEDPLVHLYRVDGDARVYLHAVHWCDHQRKRESKPKYPDPPCDGSPQSAAKCRESLQPAAGRGGLPLARARSGVGSRESRDESREPGSDARAATGDNRWQTPVGYGPSARSQSNSNGKALKQVLTDEQAIRAKSICQSIEDLPKRPGGFSPWACLQRCVSQGLPADDALKLLLGMRERWAEIRKPWAYAQEVLRREYQEFRIDLELQQHERRKHEPAQLGEILAEASRKAAHHPLTDPAHPP